MKKLILLLVLASFTPNIFGQESTHPYKDGQLLLLNGYYKPNSWVGDGMWRGAEVRYMPISSKNGMSAWGIFGSIIQVGSRIEGYHFQSMEYGIGIAGNIILNPSGIRDRFVWINAAYKKTDSQGEIRDASKNVFSDSQISDCFFFSGGMIFRSIDYMGFLPQHKLMAEMQLPFASKQKSEWNGRSLSSHPWDTERYSIKWEGSLTAIYLGYSRNYFILPNIQASYTYEDGYPRSLVGLGFGVTLSKGIYGYDILSVSYHPHFTKSEQRIDRVELLLNLVSLFRKSY